MGISEDLQRALGRIEGQLDGIMAEQRRIGAYVETTSKRVGAVEARLAAILGWAAGAGAVAGLVVTILARALL